MKKFLLYFLLILLIAGLATLAYGFWNAKNIRLWSAAAGEVKARHDIASQEKNIAGNVNALGGKKAEEFKIELDNFKSNLERISSETESAKTEIEKISAPRSVRPLRSEIIDHYIRGSEQVKNLASAVEFMNRVYAAAIVFDGITPDVTAEDIRESIGKAKAKCEEINVEILPAEVKDPGMALKAATFAYLDAFDQFASGTVENHSQLDASYDDFSQKQNDFWDARKKLTIFLNAKSMDLAGSKIDSELAILGKVKFSIK